MTATYYTTTNTDIFLGVLLIIVLFVRSLIIRRNKRRHSDSYYEVPDGDYGFGHLYNVRVANPDLIRSFIEQHLEYYPEPGIFDRNPWSQDPLKLPPVFKYGPSIRMTPEMIDWYGGLVEDSGYSHSRLPSGVLVPSNPAQGTMYFDPSTLSHFRRCGDEWFHWPFDYKLDAPEIAP